MNQPAVRKGASKEPVAISPADLTSEEGKHARVSVNPSESGYHSNISLTGVTTNSQIVVRPVRLGDVKGTSIICHRDVLLNCEFR